MSLPASVPPWGDRVEASRHGQPAETDWRSGKSLSELTKVGGVVQMYQTLCIGRREIERCLSMLSCDF